MSKNWLNLDKVCVYVKARIFFLNFFGWKFVGQDSCVTCPICEEPDAIPAIDMIFQMISPKDTISSVWVLSSVNVDQISASMVCISKYIAQHQHECCSKVR